MKSGQLFSLFVIVFVSCVWSTFAFPAEHATEDEILLKLTAILEEEKKLEEQCAAIRRGLEKRRLEILKGDLKEDWEKEEAQARLLAEEEAKTAAEARTRLLAEQRAN